MLRSAVWLASAFRLAPAFWFALLVAGTGCSSGYTGEAGERWYEWQREEHHFTDQLRSGLCDEPTATALRLWAEAVVPDRPQGTVPFFDAANMLWRAAEQCPEARAAVDAEFARLEAIVLAGGETDSERKGWYMLARQSGQPELRVRVAEVGVERPAFMGWLREDRYRREEMGSALRRTCQREDLAAYFTPTPCQAAGEAAHDAAFNAVGLVVGPILGPLMAPK